MRRKPIWLLVISLLIAACQQDEPRPTAKPLPSGPALATVAPTVGAVVSTSAAPSAAGGPVAEVVDPDQPPPMWIPAGAALAEMARTLLPALHQTAALQLAETTAPDRDDMRLAHAFLGVQHVEPPVEAMPVTVGEYATFNVTQNETNAVQTIEATMLGSSEHAYFWFDNSYGSVLPDPGQIEATGSAFDEIYETAVDVFGSEARPGIDGQDRVHVLIVSPLVLCDVSLAERERCGIAGYFNSTDSLPAAIYPLSNERDMIVMNADWFGSDFFANVLGHEFRHMIEDNYDKGDVGWEIEGSATLNEDLLGYPANAQYRANEFLKSPDLQLNHWGSDARIAHYGQAYLLNRYIYDQLGEEIYRAFVQHSADGFRALDAVAGQYSLGVSAEALWLDWLAALAIHNHPRAPRLYKFGPVGLNTVEATIVGSLSQVITGTVSQYGADYYELPDARSQIISFTGSTAVPLLPVTAVSGDMMWVSQRGNYHNPRLTRALDLRDVSKATLEYAAYVDMEPGFDYGYVSVSNDGGETWQALSGHNMQGLHPDDDPARVALADRYYTGRTQAWVQESINLNAHTGQEILLRFEYVTDPAVNYGGFAIDNVAVSDIGFYDDMESGRNGWTAEGFVQSTAYVPQNWHLQLITFPDEMPQVSALPHKPGEISRVLVETEVGEKRPLLIVAATAPNTLQPAHYELSVNGE